MAILFDSDILIHHISSPGLPGDGFTVPEAAVIRTDIDTLLARPVITALDVVPDVNTTGAGNGNALIYDSASDTWVAGAVGGTVQGVWENGTSLVTDVSFLNFSFGVTATTSTLSGKNVATVTVDFGGTGVSIAASRSDHTHAIRGDQEFPFAASGTLSSGTRPLVSDNVTGLDPAKTYIVKGTLYMHARGDGTGASFVRPRVTINANSKDIFEDSRVVAGVLITEPVPHSGASVTGVSSVAVSASVSFQPGDPAYIGGGVLVIEVVSNR